VSGPHLPLHMVSSEPEAAPPKVPYEKPELVVIDLTAEEVLAVGCKMVGRTAVGSTIQVCMANNCSQRGS
jgi:hypothetical protein